MLTQGKNLLLLFADRSTGKKALQELYLALKLLFWQKRDQFGKIETK